MAEYFQIMMDSSDEEPQIEDDEDVLCKYGTALTPYEAGKFSEETKKIEIIYVSIVFRRNSIKKADSD